MAELETRQMGRTGMQAKALGLGCAFFGTDTVTDEQAVEGIRRAVELGLNYVDTSPLYGQSERRVGLALEGGLREKVYLQTKTGTHPEHRHDFSAEITRWSVENSLKLLKTDYLDAVLIHDPPDIEDPLAPGRALDELLKMKEEGILGHIGLGVRPYEFHRRAIETGHIEIILSYLDYNLLSQTVAETTLPLARKHGVALILASVFGMGTLAGPEPDLETERRRIPDREPRAHAMWEWCRDHGVNIRHLAMQFCLAAPIEGIVMAGPSNKQQVEEAVEAATTIVPPEVWRAFKAEFGVGLVPEENPT
ncbi:MAG: aldo/keto reductase [bacterium]|nr:aldo/keto reductase [bacterium]